MGDSGDIRGGGVAIHLVPASRVARTERGTTWMGLGNAYGAIERGWSVRQLVVGEMA